MARPLRLEYPGAWYHVTARGNERRNIFRDDRDREWFVGLLAVFEERFRVEVHGYVLMDNHYHLLLHLQGESGLSAAMHYLGVSYSVWFNRRHRRSGHLFQGRFKAIIVDFDSWGASLSRYIHLNPVRTRRHKLDKTARALDRVGAGEGASKEEIKERITTLREYAWSSYPGYCSGKGPAWLHLDDVLSRFGRGAKARAEYRQYVEETVREGTVESPWEQVIGGLVLGGAELLEKVRARLIGDPNEQSGMREIKRMTSLEEVVEAISRLRGEKWEDFRERHGDWGQAMVLLVARRNLGFTNRQLAEWLGGVDDSTISQAVRRLERRMVSDSKLKRFYKKLQTELSNVKMRP